MLQYCASISALSYLHVGEQYNVQVVLTTENALIKTEVIDKNHKLSGLAMPLS